MQLRPGEPEEVGMSAQRVRRVGQLAAGWVAQGITSALVILVARRGVVVLHEAFGRLTPDDNAPPVKHDTLYPLSSLTKPITATAAMLLVEDGLLGLQRPVSDYLPEFSGEGKQAVMVHHLLTHTSGLRDEDVNAHAAKKRGVVAIPPPEATQHPWINEYLFLRYDVPLWKPPGVEMFYGNYNYDLLGEIVRRVSGQALADFARTRIFEPLGM
jgi:CubicO group peptidase (beta-lactamase class C family)